MVHDEAGPRTTTLNGVAAFWPPHPATTNGKAAIKIARIGKFMTKQCRSVTYPAMTASPDKADAIAEKGTA
ncbi:hypothetical protein ACFB49_33240 [Sphingomonas sp. DBB INV C78]